MTTVFDLLGLGVCVLGVVGVSYFSYWWGFKDGQDEADGWEERWTINDGGDHGDGDG